MATATTLEFEKPIVELQNQIDELKKMAEKQQLTVGDEIAPLETRLYSGDMCEIIIDKNRKGPNPDWMKFVKTHHAKDRIKAFAKKRRQGS